MLAAAAAEPRASQGLARGAALQPASLLAPVRWRAWRPRGARAGPASPRTGPPPQVRMMLPMTVRCNVCGTFMYKGTKFNTRMEDVRGEDYLGIKIFRCAAGGRACWRRVEVQGGSRTAALLRPAPALACPRPAPASLLARSFYYRCTHCSAEFCMKTDPKNAGGWGGSSLPPVVLLLSTLAAAASPAEAAAAAPPPPPLLVPPHITTSSLA